MLNVRKCPQRQKFGTSRPIPLFSQLHSSPEGYQHTYVGHGNEHGPVYRNPGLQEYSDADWMSTRAPLLPFLSLPFRGFWNLFPRLMGAPTVPYQVSKVLSSDSDSGWRIETSMARGSRAGWDARGSKRYQLHATLLWPMPLSIKESL